MNRFITRALITVFILVVVACAVPVVEETGEATASTPPAVRRKGAPRAAPAPPSWAPTTPSPSSSISEMQARYESIVLPPVSGKKPYVASMDLRGSGGPQAENIAAALSDPLRNELVNTGYCKVCDRANMETILKEVGFQQSGCTSSECVVQVGRILGVEKIITGSVGKLGNTYNISLQLIDVATGLVDRSVSETAACQEGELFYLVGIAAKRLCMAQN